MGQAVTQGDETVLVTGGGQLAGALGRQAWPAGLTPLYLPRDRLDITDREAVAAVLRAHPISAIINTAAWTDVDGAEAAERQAYAVNAEAPALLADAAERAGACLIHVSTDYVFGHGQGPWEEEARTVPLNVYGATKAFVKQFSLNLRADLAGTAIRVTNVEPGLCGGTEFSNVRFHGDDAKAATVYQGVQAIQPEDIANTVLWVSQQPAHVNINSIEIMPVAQTFGPLQISRR